MNKIVYNACYGGFGLSEQAMLRYAELKGIKLYVEKDSFCTYYWTNPEATIEEFDKYQEYYFEGDFDRHDPILVQVVEELGREKASHEFANISIYETENNAYRIDEYDGYETVVTQSNQDWIIIK